MRELPQQRHLLCKYSWAEIREAVSPAAKKIRERVSQLSVLNCDETGLRVAGALHWLHCMCNENWSYFLIHKNRAYHLRYDSIVSDGFAANVVPVKPKWKRGWAAKGKIVCLLERLRDFKADILRFASDWSVRSVWKCFFYHD